MNTGKVKKSKPLPDLLMSLQWYLMLVEEDYIKSKLIVRKSLDLLQLDR